VFLSKIFYDKSTLMRAARVLFETLHEKGTIMSHGNQLTKLWPALPLLFSLQIAGCDSGCLPTTHGEGNFWVGSDLPLSVQQKHYTCAVQGRSQAELDTLLREALEVRNIIAAKAALDMGAQVRGQEKRQEIPSSGGLGDVAQQYNDIYDDIKKGSPSIKAYWGTDIYQGNPTAMALESYARLAGKDPDLARKYRDVPFLIFNQVIPTARYTGDTPKELPKNGHFGLANIIEATLKSMHVGSAAELVRINANYLNTTDKIGTIEWALIGIADQMAYYSIRGKRLPKSFVEQAVQLVHLAAKLGNPRVKKWHTHDTVELSVSICQFLRRFTAMRTLSNSGSDETISSGSHETISVVGLFPLEVIQALKENGIGVTGTDIEYDISMCR
jgi:hypothetical protein